MSGRDAILLLGGSGFIGWALTRRLAAQGRKLHVVSRRPMPDAGPNVTVHLGDLADTALLDVMREQCKAVVHLASTSTPGSSSERPVLELDNLAPTLRLLQHLQQWQDTHLIFLSSGGAVYGNPSHNPVSELAPLAPLSYYGAGKVALEGFLAALRAAGNPVTILRPSNAYGPGQGLDGGFGLVRTVLQHTMQGTALHIWGDGENVRDYSYVDDVADAIELAIDAPADSATYNVGSGMGHSVNQVAQIAIEVCGRPLAIEYHPARGVDVREVVLDISLMRSAFGWRPRVSLEQGMARTWEWLKKA